MSGTYSSLNFHVVFSTKERFHCISEEFELELHDYIAGVILGEGGKLLKIGGTTNHLHLAIQLKPTHFIPDMMRRIKGHSSKWINERKIVAGNFSWQRGYGIFSVSESQIQKLFQYIGNQKEHHKQISFEDEMENFLSKHRIEFKREHLWSE